MRLKPFNKAAKPIFFARAPVGPGGLVAECIEPQSVYHVTTCALDQDGIEPRLAVSLRPKGHRQYHYTTAPANKAAKPRHAEFLCAQSLLNKPKLGTHNSICLKPFEEGSQTYTHNLTRLKLLNKAAKPRRTQFHVPKPFEEGSQTYIHTISRA